MPPTPSPFPCFGRGGKMMNSWFDCTLTCSATRPSKHGPEGSLLELLSTMNDRHVMIKSVDHSEPISFLFQNHLQEYRISRIELWSIKIFEREREKPRPLSSLWVSMDSVEKKEI